MNKRISPRVCSTGVLVILLALFLGASRTFLVLAQADNPNPPAETIKLVFIHHSCGENWLTDDYGNLGRFLGQNNYFVSDTNYGWGPDSIGDRTDIVNWPEWFRSPESGRYMAALFAESGQNSSYTRTLADPGGENRIVMFKSCFPNSNLEGNPDDPAAAGEGLTVSNAKYIYNDLLNYFRTRPDKLFIVVTAPPVQDPTYAANARAFNTWLVKNWLQENQYPYPNVAVFDFYNVLTHPENHHRFVDGQIQYINSHGRGTSAYASNGDDHPNPAGSQKATDEFVPLLNVYVNRWQSGAVAAPQPTAQLEIPAGPTSPAVEAPPSQPIGGDLVDDFEAGLPGGSQGWQAFWDEATQTKIACTPEAGMAYQGNRSLHINFSVQADSWATCALFYDQLKDWRGAQGLSFVVHANQPGFVFDLIAYRGPHDQRQAYQFSVETTPEMTAGWVPMEVTWDMLLGVEWEENAGSPLNPDQVSGVAIGFGTFPSTPSIGEVWIDDVRLMGVTPSEPAASPLPPVETEPAPAIAEPTESSPAAEETSRRRLCPGSLGLGLLVIGLLAWSSKQNKKI